MRRVPIRMKLAAALAVPLVALVIVTVLEVVKSSQEAQQVREQSALAEASIGPASLLSMLENERNAVAVYLLGQENNFALPAGVEDSQTTVDEAVREFRAEIEAQGGEIEDAYAPALDKLSALADLRAEVDAAPDSNRTLQNIDMVSRIFDDYSALMDGFFSANKRVALAVDDPDLRRGAELIDLSARQTNLLAILVRDLLLATVGGESPDGLNTPAEVTAVAASLGQLRANEQLIATKATGMYRQYAEALFADPSVQRFPQVVDEAIETGQPVLDDVITHSAGEDADTFGYTVFRRDVSDALVSRAEELEAAASARQTWFLVLAVLAVGVATVVTWIVSRSITKPLRTLTRQAKDMAERRLPDAVLDILQTPLGEDVVMPSIQPVRVHTRDEVADVSAALNTVQETALDLAVEQAVLRRNIADSFVNLGRRNQNLLGRQLDFITELESNESDPDTLANLFRLDHLATRMRRNAESLLVLAGIEPPRKWAAPVRLTDVIRASLGEVEDYQRVTVRGVEPATILGSVAADLAHLLAELIENALVFSPPDQTVDIRGRNRPPGPDTHDGGYTLAIIDSGLGMPPADIAAANRRLAGAESFTIAPSKYLGHYVAGNLAARHDIRVSLANSPGNGITATIDLPPTLLTTDTAVAAPITPPHGTRAVTAGAGTSAPAVAPPRMAGPAWSGAPVDAAPAAPAPAARAGFPQEGAEPRRTQSGLVKRASRAGNGQPIGAPEPSGDLLDNLSRHTANLQTNGLSSSPPTSRPRQQPPAEVDLRVPPRPAWDAPAESARPRWDAPSSPTGTGWDTPATPSGTGWDTPSTPSGTGWDTPSTPSGGGWEALRPPTPSWDQPQQPVPTSWEPVTPRPVTHEPPVPTWTPTPPPADWTPGGPTGGSRADRPSAPAPPPARHPADDPSGTTPGGLARRVRGAQLPTTEPLRMRRGGNQGAAARAASPASTTPPPRTPEQQRHADEVYNFLSQFTAGVRRGIEESSR